jgi:hypothetical protein
MKSLSTGCWRLVIILPAFLGISCSGQKLNPVSGKVLVKDQPAEGVLLTFHPKSGNADIHTVLPVGKSKEDGTFILMTGDKEGAAAGEYVVTAIWPENVTAEGKKALGGQRFKSEDRLNGAYAREANSQINVEIVNGKTELAPMSVR